MWDEIWSSLQIMFSVIYDAIWHLINPLKIQLQKFSSIIHGLLVMVRHEIPGVIVQRFRENSEIGRDFTNSLKQFRSFMKSLKISRAFIKSLVSHIPCNMCMIQCIEWVYHYLQISRCQMSHHEVTRVIVTVIISRGYLIISHDNIN